MSVRKKTKENYRLEEVKADFHNRAVWGDAFVQKPTFTDKVESRHLVALLQLAGRCGSC